MKKKLVSVLMAGVLASAMLAGCGSSGSADTSADTAEDTAEETTEDAAEETTEAVELNYSGEIKVWVADAAVDFTNEQIGRAHV